MKIARLLHDNNETYGFVSGDKVSTKDEITFLTGVTNSKSKQNHLFSI
jgi:hypothetical protein